MAAFLKNVGLVDIDTALEVGDGAAAFIAFQRALLVKVVVPGQVEEVVHARTAIAAQQTSSHADLSFR